MQRARVEARGRNGVRASTATSRGGKPTAGRSEISRCHAGSYYAKFRLRANSLNLPPVGSTRVGNEICEPRSGPIIGRSFSRSGARRKSDVASRGGISGSTRDLTPRRAVARRCAPVARGRRARLTGQRAVVGADAPAALRASQSLPFAPARFLRSASSVLARIARAHFPHAPREAPDTVRIDPPIANRARVRTRTPPSSRRSVDRSRDRTDVNRAGRLSPPLAFPAEFSLSACARACATVVCDERTRWAR